MKEKEHTETSPDDLVVVGSSAGGIKALSILVGSLPENFPAPVVLAQHLDPTHPSNLDQILQKRTVLSVEVITTSSVLQAGRIYVVPENYHVRIQNHCVEAKDDCLQRPQPSVNTLFSTAAAAYGEHLIAVILTGAGSDGAEGAIDVKNMGGIVIVQNPQTARYPSMPLSLPPTIIDHERNVEQIGPLLSELLTKVSPPSTEERTENILREILVQVSQQASIDFCPYKTSTILRRINRRMVVTRVRNMRDYAQYLKTHPEEIGELVKEFLINVTQFFRDPEAFDYLKNDILPQLITQARERNHSLRFWSAGCATGEESYSLAMLLTNLLGVELPEWSIKIFATDLDAPAIDFARRGIYSEALLKGVPNKYRDRFFEHTEQGGYRISKTLRQMVIFGQQDLSRSAPFQHIDLVLCRNVLIYFTPELQETVLGQFAFSLYPYGYLFLGKAETVRPVQPSYELVSKQWKVYRCVGRALPLGYRQPLLDQSMSHLEGYSMKRQNRSMSKTDGEQKPAPLLEINQLRRFDEVLLRFLPVGVVVIDRAYRIVTVNGSARRLLGLREVGTDQDFLHTVHGVPYHQMRTAIDTVFRQRDPIHLTGVKLETIPGENGRYVNLSLALLQAETEFPNLALISVIDVTPQIQAQRQLETIQTEQTKLLHDWGTANKQLNDINKELIETNEGLQVANEELVLTHEELQASIEEFETTNEELQATNEELETNNEELQATNEELETTNDELRARTNELQELTTQLANERGRLAKMVELAPFYILVLRGPNLVVEAYNPSCARWIANRPIQGQPLEKVVDLFWETGWEILHLARDTYLLDVPQSRSRVLTAFPKQEISGEQTKAYFTYTTVPSHGVSGEINGVVIYALDETAKRLREEVEEHKRLNVIFNNLSTVALALYDAQTGKLLMGSTRYLGLMASLHHLKSDELIGRSWQELTLVSPLQQAIHFWQMTLENQTATHIAELSSEMHLGEKTFWDDTLTPIMDVNEPGKVRFVLVSAVDMTEQVRVQKEVERLGNLKDEFVSLASHELRNPLTAIRGNAQLVQRDIKKQKMVLSGNTEQEQRLDRDSTLLDRIVGQTDQINELISEMLDSARIREQVFELKRKADVNIVEIAQHVITQCAHDDLQSKIVLQSEEQTIPGMWDAHRIEQVFSNLITNALKYSPADKPIVVEVKRQSVDMAVGTADMASPVPTAMSAVSTDEVLVSVHDQGPGIPEKDQAHIFERFYQGNDAKQKSHKGLGLGLYISSEIVTQHGGCIWVRSRPGQWSTFYFTLPLNSVSV